MGNKWNVDEDGNLDVVGLVQGRNVAADGAVLDTAILQAASTVYVYSMDNFPAADAGVRTLAANTQYIIMANLSTSDRFVIPTGSTNNFVGSAFNLGTTTNITYTGSATFFTGSDIAALQLFDIQFLNSGSGTLYSISATASNFPFITFYQCLAAGWASLGAAANVRFFGFNSAHVNNSDGLTLTDCLSFDLVRGAYFNTITTNDALFRLTGTDPVTGLIDGPRIIPLAGESGFDLDATLDAASSLIFNAARFTGAGDALDPTGIDTKDKRVISQGNVGLRDSQTLGETYLLIDEEVTINTQSVAEVIDGVNWVDGPLERVLATTGGRLTYDGIEDITLLIKGQATIAKVGGGSDLLELCIFKNGSAVDQPCSGTQNSTPTSVSVSAIIDVENGDFFELYVVNQGSDANVDVSSALIEMIKS